MNMVYLFATKPKPQRIYCIKFKGFDRFDCRQHGLRLEAAFHQGDGVGEIPAGSADRRIEDDGRGIEQPELLIEPGNRGFDNLRRPPVAPVQTV